MTQQSQPVLFCLQVVEHDSWSGSKVDGYYCFLEKSRAKEFAARKHAGRNGPTPEYYVNYEPFGFQPCRPGPTS